MSLQGNRSSSVAKGRIVDGGQRAGARRPWDASWTYGSSTLLRRLLAPFGAACQSRAPERARLRWDLLHTMVRRGAVDPIRITETRALPPRRPIGGRSPATWWMTDAEAGIPNAGARQPSSLTDIERVTKSSHLIPWRRPWRVQHPVGFGDRGRGGGGVCVAMGLREGLVGFGFLML